MLVAELVNELWLRAGVVADGFELPTARQSKSGLRFLNTILGEKSMDGNGIVYVTHKVETLVPNQEVYFIPELITLEVLSFQLDGNLRYPQRSRTRNEYFGPARVDDINTLPVTYHFERQKGGADIYLYPKPDQAYQMNIIGKFANPTNLKLDDDILTELDDYYVSYLRNEGARRAAAESGTPLNPDVLVLLRELKSRIEPAPGIDTIQRRGVRGRRASSTFRVASYTSHNLWTGWSP